MLEKLKLWKMRLENCLVEDWKQLHKHWSAQWALLTTLLAGLEQLDLINLLNQIVPYTSYILPNHIFGYLSIVTALLTYGAKFIHQKKLDAPE